MKTLNSVENPHNGFYYFTLGWKLAFSPGIRQFVFFPLLINLALLGIACWWLFKQLESWVNQLTNFIPGGLQWIGHLIWTLAILAALLVFGYLFNTLANWIAAPFNSLLAEKLEAKLIGINPPDTCIQNFINDIPRVVKREGRKILYYLPRILALFIFSFIPGIGQFFGPVLFFFFSAWMLAIQYCDYAFDNHKIAFSLMHRQLKQHRFLHLQFGSLVSLFIATPVLNMIIMPVAVCGATAIWVDYYRKLDSE